VLEHSKEASGRGPEKKQVGQEGLEEFDENKRAEDWMLLTSLFVSPNIVNKKRLSS
jgi:hypothetical protein